MSGNMTLTADVLLTGASAQEKRKAALMIRQSLDPGSAYADIAFHGNGEVAAQWRLAPGDVTGDAVLPKFLDTKVPERIRIERQGNTFTVMAGGARWTTRRAGALHCESGRPGVCRARGLLARRRRVDRRGVHQRKARASPLRRGADLPSGAEVCRVETPNS